jgi:putative hydrolase of the HAD superfamily
MGSRSARPERAVVGVTLDVGGVLTLPPILDVLAHHGIRVSPQELLVAHHRGVAVEDSLLAGAPGSPDALGAARSAMFTTVADACGARGSAQAAVADALAQIGLSGSPWTVVVPGALEVVTALTDAGFGVAIVSNSDGTVESQLASLGICQVDDGPAGRVAGVVDSGVVGVRKPDPAIFEHALAALDTRAPATAHVGDTVAFDVLAASRAGMVPVHFDSSRTCEGDHPHVVSLDELPDVLSAI